MNRKYAKWIYNRKRVKVNTIEIPSLTELSQHPRPSADTELWVVNRSTQIQTRLHKGIYIEVGCVYNT